MILKRRIESWPVIFTQTKTTRRQRRRLLRQSVGQMMSSAIQRNGRHTTSMGMNSRVRGEAETPLQGGASQAMVVECTRCLRKTYLICFSTVRGDTEEVDRGSAGGPHNTSSSDSSRSTMRRRNGVGSLGIICSNCCSSCLSSCYS